LYHKFNKIRAAMLTSSILKKAARNYYSVTAKNSRVKSGLNLAMP
jgi:hypothetical protein